MTSTLKLHGIVPPVATPYDHAGQIDPQGLRAVLRHLIDGGVHGLFVLGSTSECVFLNAAQRALVIETAVQEAAGRVPVLVGVMDATTDHCIAHGRQAQALGAQALVLTAPYYTRTNQTETLDHFRYVRDAVDLPVVAYDIPVCVNIKLARDTVNTLAREQVVVALKDSSGDEGGFRMLLRDLQDLPDFALFTGSEVVADAALLGGAHGIVPGLANVDPHGYVRLYDHARAGRWKEARAEQDRLIRLFQMVFFAANELSAGASGVGSFKTALKLMGLIKSHHMGKPNRPLPPAAVERVRQHLIEMNLLAACGLAVAEDPRAKHWAGGLIVSCQPLEGGAMDQDEIVVAMALAAQAGGATALRIEGAARVRQVVARVGIPVVGIVKRDLAGSAVRITPLLEDVDALCAAGATVVAVDATQRLRPVPVAALLERIKQGQCLAMADCSCLTDGLAARDLGFDWVGSTLSGYTADTLCADDSPPDWALIRQLSQQGCWVVAEGRLRTPAHATQALREGARAVTVGSAITRVEHITSWFVQALRPPVPDAGA